jgi:D-3-phosphoglycerate dehydrogenase
VVKILVLESYALSAMARLQAQRDVEATCNPADLATADILLIRSQTQVDLKLLAKAPHLKLVVTATSGFDHVDWRACQARGVTCAHTPNANAQSTAELTFTLLLAMERHLIEVRRNVRESRWREGLSRPNGLEGQTLGIIGLGRVGRRVAAIAHAFGMKLIGYDPYIEDQAFADLHVERHGMIEVLRSAEIVSLHVPLTKETRHLLNQPTFKEMQEHALLLNTCRGPVVDENDLMVALDEATIRGAAMDVIEREPPPAGHRLLAHPKLLLTPHIGAFTERAWEKASNEAVEKAIAYKNNQPIGDTLPLSAPWFEHA